MSKHAAPYNLAAERNDRRELPHFGKRCGCVPCTGRRLAVTAARIDRVLTMAVSR